MTTDSKALHQHLLDMLGARDHEDAGAIIARLHAAALTAQQPVGGEWGYVMTRDDGVQLVERKEAEARIKSAQAAGEVVTEIIEAASAFYQLTHSEKWLRCSAESKRLRTALARVGFKMREYQGGAA